LQNPLTLTSNAVQLGMQSPKAFLLLYPYPQTHAPLIKASFGLQALKQSALMVSKTVPIGHLTSWQIG
jgi:hypothetical protein